MLSPGRLRPYSTCFLRPKHKDGTPHGDGPVRRLQTRIQRDNLKKENPTRCLGTKWGVVEGQDGSFTPYPGRDPRLTSSTGHPCYNAHVISLTYPDGDEYTYPPFYIRVSPLLRVIVKYSRHHHPHLSRDWCSICAQVQE